MDIPRVFISLRPGATFTDNTVNFFSLETVAKTYIGTMPAQAEMDAEWLTLKAQDNDPVLQEDIKKEGICNFSNVDPFLMAYALCINDGSIVPGTGMTKAALKTVVKAKL